MSFIIIFNSIVSCKQGEFKNTSSISIKNDNVNIKNNLTCQEIVEKIVNSSNLDVKIYKNFSVEIDNIKNDSILIHVYFENNLSEDPKQKQIVESTIAWLLLLTGKQKLYNITVDPEKPKELKFDKTILANNDIFKICNIQKQKN